VEITMMKSALQDSRMQALINEKMMKRDKYIKQTNIHHNQTIIESTRAERMS